MSEGLEPEHQQVPSPGAGGRLPDLREILGHADYIWIAIRVFGLYLLLRALSSAVSFLALLALSAVLLAESLWLSEGAARTGWGFMGTYAGQAAAEVLQALVYFFVGRYLVRDGRRVFAWVRPSRA